MLCFLNSVFLKAEPPTELGVIIPPEAESRPVRPTPVTGDSAPRQHLGEVFGAVPALAPRCGLRPAAGLARNAGSQAQPRPAAHTLPDRLGGSCGHCLGSAELGHTRMYVPKTKMH